MRRFAHRIFIRFTSAGTYGVSLSVTAGAQNGTWMYGSRTDMKAELQFVRAMRKAESEPTAERIYTERALPLYKHLYSV